MENNNLESLINQCKESALEAQARILRTFAHVPDEKLIWSPSEKSKSALQIVAHCAMGNHAFATILRGEELPMMGGPEETMAELRRQEQSVATRDQAIQMLEENTQSVLAALDGVKPEQLSTHPNSPFGPMPFVFWMMLPGMHVGNHAAQIDYIQTIWGDLTVH